VAALYAETFEHEGEKWQIMFQVPIPPMRQLAFTSPAD
jgi:hypothetical protein